MLARRTDERFESAPGDLSTASATGVLGLPKPKLAPIASCETLTDSYDVTVDLQGSDGVSGVGVGGEVEAFSWGSSPRESVSDDSCTSPAMITVRSASNDQHEQKQHQRSTTPRRLQLPTTTTLDSLSVSSPDELRTAASSDTLVPGSPAYSDVQITCTAARPTTSAPSQTPASGLKHSLSALLLVNFRGSGVSGGRKSPTSLHGSHQLNALALSPSTSPKFSQSSLGVLRRLTSPPSASDSNALSGPAATTRRATSPSPLHRSPVCSPKLPRAASPISYSYSSPNIITNMTKSRTAGAAACMYIYAVRLLATFANSFRKFCRKFFTSFSGDSVKI